MQTVWVKILY